MRKLFLLFLFVSVSFAQYTNQDYNLIKTTFLREFDKGIIGEYLNSNDESKINAALLSIAQSEDTSFVGLVTKLDFDKYGEYISFALGELGPCNASIDYLVTQLRKGKCHSIPLYEAIGKIGDEQDLLETTEIFKENNSDGYPLAVFNFHIRGIVDSTEADIKLLMKNLKLNDNPEKLFRSVFALYRVAPDKINLKDLEIILKGNFDSSTKSYALGILRKNSSFPFPFELVRKVIHSDNWSVRCEAARTVCFYKYDNLDQVNVFLDLLHDSNPNVAVTAAQSISKLAIDSPDIEKELKNKVAQLINDQSLSKNVRGELLLTLQEWQPDSTNLLYTKYNDITNQNYIYQFLGSSNDIEFGYGELKRLYGMADEYNKFSIYSSISNFYDSLKHDEDYTNFIIDQYSSDLPLVITLNNFVIDSTFAAVNSSKLTQVITNMVGNHISDSKFNQAISTLFNVTDLIDTAFSNSLLKVITDSKNYELQYDLRNEIEFSETAKNQRVKLFDELYKNIFEFSQAVVETNKGNFTIKFTPEVAPISVGNFIYLAKKDFFDNILFHRVVPNFVIQTGDPSETGWSGPSHTIVSEFSPQPFDTYYVGVASSGKDTEGSQWFVMNNNYPHLNGNYTNFGKVVSGYKTVNIVDQLDTVINIELIK